MFAVGRRAETCMSLTLNLFAWLLFAVLCACAVVAVVDVVQLVVAVAVAGVHRFCGCVSCRCND